MGFGIVDIWKIAEADDFVTYAYDYEGRRGEFTISRSSGEITSLRMAPGSAGYAAQHKIRTAWRSGELPARAVWAG